jgi:hypothetical protein
MSGRVTQADLRRVFTTVQIAWTAAHVSQYERTTETWLHADHLHLVLGSKTYGTTYRLVYVLPRGGGHVTPEGLTGGHLGLTAREAYLSLAGIAAGLYIARNAQRLTP